MSIVPSRPSSSIGRKVSSPVKKHRMSGGGEDNDGDVDYLRGLEEEEKMFYMHR